MGHSQDRVTPSLREGLQSEGKGVQVHDEVQLCKGLMALPLRVGLFGVTEGDFLVDPCPNCSVGSGPVQIDRCWRCKMGAVPCPQEREEGV